MLESVPNKRLVMTWGEAVAAADKAKHSRVAIDIETVGEMVRLTVTHDETHPGNAAKDHQRLAARAVKPQVVPGNRASPQHLGLNRGRYAASQSPGEKEPRYIFK